MSVYLIYKPGDDFHDFNDKQYVSKYITVFINDGTSTKIKFQGEITKNTILFKSRSVDDRTNNKINLELRLVYRNAYILNPSVRVRARKSRLIIGENDNSNYCQQTNDIEIEFDVSFRSQSKTGTIWFIKLETKLLCIAHFDGKVIAQIETDKFCKTSLLLQLSEKANNKYGSVINILWYEMFKNPKYNFVDDQCDECVKLSISYDQILDDFRQYAFDIFE